MAQVAHGKPGLLYPRLLAEPMKPLVEPYLVKRLTIPIEKKLFYPIRSREAHSQVGFQGGGGIFRKRYKPFLLALALDKKAAILEIDIFNSPRKQLEGASQPPPGSGIPAAGWGRALCG